MVLFPDAIKNFTYSEDCGKVYMCFSCIKKIFLNISLPKLWHNHSPKSQNPRCLPLNRRPSRQVRRRAQSKTFVPPPGVCAALADRHLENFTPGRPINHGRPGVSTGGSVPSFQRPQVDPRPFGRSRRSPDSPRPPPGLLTRPVPRPRPGRSPDSPRPPPAHLTRPVSRPQRSPNSPVPPGHQTRPQTQPTPPPGRETRPQVLPAHLTKPAHRPQRSPNSPTPPPGYQPKPQVQPTPPPGHQPVQTLPAEIPEDKTAVLPPKTEGLKPAEKPQVEPRPSPADLTKPFPRPPGPQTLPAALP